MEQEKKLVELSEYLIDENTYVVFDTNIYLNLYEFSPEITEFFVGLCNIIKDKLYLPNTVKIEFDSNYQTSLNRQRNKFRNAISNLKNPVNTIEDKLIRQFGILSSFNFPGIDELKDSVCTSIESMRATLDSYIESHQEFEEINRSFLDGDIISELVYELVDSNQLLDEFTISEIYKLCNEGERRYKNKIPPGYKDDKDKKGVSAYGDFFIWKEVLNFCSFKKKNLIFVTDDLKEDWYIIEQGKRLGLRKELIDEFSKMTSFKIIGVTSKEFFTNLAILNNQEIPSTAEWIMGYDLENYIDDIKYSNINTDFEEIVMYTLDQYIDTSTLTGYDGTNFEYEDNSFEVEVLNGIFEGYENGRAEYTFTLKVKATCYSNEYYGRDMDTKDVILSPNRIHKLIGEFDVRLTRGLDSYMDYWARANIYDEIEILQGLFLEESMVRSEDLCIECGKNEGVYLNYYQDPVCNNCMIVNSNGEICTFCGIKVPMEFMFSDNMCNNCSEDRDD